MADGLHRIFTEEAHAAQVVEELLASNRKWGARDRNFIADSIYSMVRYYRLYSYGAGLKQAFEPQEFWRIMAVYFTDKEINLPEWPEWKDTDIAAVRVLLLEGRKQPAVAESFPDWLCARGLGETGSRWNAEMQALNQAAPLCIRVNTIKARKEAVEALMQEEGILFEETAAAPQGLVLHTRKNLRSTQAWQAGWLEVQDISSQQVAPMLRAAPDMKVIDACAGAGGKSLHLASLMQNRGTILAMDVLPEKLKELELRARRAGASIIRTALHSDAADEGLHHFADRLLLDVPCSGTGIIRRQPDHKWKLSEAELERLTALQKELLERYQHLLKPGGLLTYATCSILPSENERQVQRFLASNSGFEILEERHLSPRESGYDGFYICTMLKNK